MTATERDVAVGTNQDQSRLLAGMSGATPRAETAGPSRTVIADELLAGGARVTAKLYVLAVLDEVEAATARYLMELHKIRAKYRDELTEPDAFRLLIQAAESGLVAAYRAGLPDLGKGASRAESS